MVFIQQIAAEKRALAWYLRTYSKFSFRRIAEECGISKSSARRICSNEFGNGSETRIMTRSEKTTKCQQKKDAFAYSHLDVYLLWTTTPHRPVELRNSPLKILKEPFMKSHPSHQISIHREYLSSCYLNQEAISRNIIKESFDEFKVRVLEAFGNIPVEIIDKTISSMNWRMTSILTSKDERMI